jgi:hypothetical protein
MEDPNDPTPGPQEYQAPAIEDVLTPEQLAREIQYAGLGSIPG